MFPDNHRPDIERALTFQLFSRATDSLLIVSRCNVTSLVDFLNQAKYLRSLEIEAAFIRENKTKDQIFFLWKGDGRGVTLYCIDWR